MRTILNQPPAVAPATRTAPTPAAMPFPAGAAGAPPLRLPGGHFAAALAFWVAGAAGLVWIAPELAAGAFPVPRVVAVAHLFTLGWITTSIQGALYQFLPVALGTPIRWQGLAHLTGAVYVAGLAVFVPALALGAHGTMIAGAAAFGTALLVFALNLAATLRRSRERGLTWWCLAAATSYLVVTVVLGAALAGNLRWGFLGGERFTALGVHLHVAALGWVLLVMIGVGHRLLPMFLLSHGASERAGKAAAALVGGGVFLLVALHHVMVPALRWTVGALLAAGTAAFLAQARAWYRARRRPKVDAGMRLAAAGLVLLAVTLALGAAFLYHGLALPRLATAYGTAMIAGGLGLFVAGHHYKIVPFLVWFHRFGPLAGRRPLPTVADLYAARPAAAAALLLPLGALALVAAVLAGSAAAARAGAAAYLAGACILAAQMAGVFTRRPA